MGSSGRRRRDCFWRQGRELQVKSWPERRPRGDRRGRAIGWARIVGERQRSIGTRHRSQEHPTAVAFVRRTIGGRCEKRRCCDWRPSNIWYSRVTAHLLEGCQDGALIDRLHPTPAVGGYPTENALDEIRRLETFQRGWYAAPVGWIGVDEAEFAVAIRSGLVHQRTADPVFRCRHRSWFDRRRRNGMRLSRRSAISCVATPALQPTDVAVPVINVRRHGRRTPDDCLRQSRSRLLARSTPAFDVALTIFFSPPALAARR